MLMEGSSVKDWYVYIIRLSCRKHQIPSASVRQRPQPRQPEYLESQSKLSPQFPNSDLIPRSNIPHLVTPPVPYDRRPPEQRVGGRDGILTAPSFTFLPSTVSVLSSPPSDHWQVQHSDPHTVGGLCQGPLPVTRVPETEFQQSLSPPRPVLLPPSAFSSNRPTADTASAHRGPPTAALAGQRVTTKGEEVSGLDDPAVRSRIVHVRDELRRYHQMRVKKRTLEQQVADSSSPQLAEVSVQICLKIPCCCYCHAPRTVCAVYVVLSTLLCYAAASTASG